MRVLDASLQGADNRKGHGVWLVAKCTKGVVKMFRGDFSPKKSMVGNETGHMQLDLALDETQKCAKFEERSFCRRVDEGTRQF